MDKRFIETIIAASAFSWGIWLQFIMPEDQYAGATFSGMARVAPREFWAMLLLGGGATLFLSISRGTPCYRRWALACATLTWFAIWVSFVLSNWRSAAANIYFWFFILCVYAYLRVGKNGTAGQH